MSAKAKSSTHTGARSNPKRDVRFATPQNDHPRSTASRRWRTSGPVSKQSTLTQIDFVRRGSFEKQEDLDLEYEKDTTLVNDEEYAEPKRKRRKLEIFREDEDVKAEPSEPIADVLAIFEGDNENGPLLSPAKTHNTIPTQLLTPRKQSQRTIPSSQSPTSPFSQRSVQRRRPGKLMQSPLKDLSVNVMPRPRLVVEDTYKTNNQLSSSPSIALRSQRAVSETLSHTDEQERVVSLRRSLRKQQSLSKLEIADSEEDLSDLEIIPSSRSDELPPHFDDTTVLDDDLPPQIDLHLSAQLRLANTEAEIMKLPISDDSCSSQARAVIALAAAQEAAMQEEITTLEDSVLARPKRSYSNKRKRKSQKQISSSSSLEELPTLDIHTYTTTSGANHAVDMPSSPPQASPKSTPMYTTASVDQIPSVTLSRRSDSQQATAQLEQESQWQPPMMPPSQASTASLYSSPVREEVRKTQSSSNRRSWLFNPLTDSQLLPDSIMNFELPRFSGMLGGRGHAVDEELEEDI